MQRLIPVKTDLLLNYNIERSCSKKNEARIKYKYDRDFSYTSLKQSKQVILLYKLFSK